MEWFMSGNFADCEEDREDSPTYSTADHHHTEI